MSAVSSYASNGNLADYCYYYLFSFFPGVLPSGSVTSCYFASDSAKIVASVEVR